MYRIAPDSYGSSTILGGNMSLIVFSFLSAGSSRSVQVDVRKLASLPVLHSRASLWVLRLDMRRYLKAINVRTLLRGANRRFIANQRLYCVPLSNYCVPFAYIVHTSSRYQSIPRRYIHINLQRSHIRPRHLFVPRSDRHTVTVYRASVDRDKGMRFLVAYHWHCIKTGGKRTKRDHFSSTGR